MDAEETIESKKRGEQIKKEIRKMIADYQKTPLYSSMLKIKKIIGEWENFVDLREEIALFDEVLEKEERKWWPTAYGQKDERMNV